MKRIVMAIVAIVALGGVALATLGADDHEAGQHAVSALTPDMPLLAVNQLDDFTPEALALFVDGSEVAIIQPGGFITHTVSTNPMKLCALTCDVGAADNLPGFTTSAESQPDLAFGVNTHQIKQEVLAPWAPGETKAFS